MPIKTIFTNRKRSSRFKAHQRRSKPKGTYAYVFEAHNYYVPKLLNKLQQQQYSCKSRTHSFYIRRKNYDYGTYMVPVKNQVISEE